MSSIITNVHGTSRRGLLRNIGVGGLAALASTGLNRASSAAESYPLPDIVIEWLGAWSSVDPAARLASLYAKDGSYEDVAFGASVLGPDIESYLREYFAGMTLINRYLRTSFAIDGLAVAEQLYRAKSEMFDPDGAEFQVYAVTIFRYGRNVLYRTTDYYDFSSIISQLNVLPSIPYGDCKSG